MASSLVPRSRRALLAISTAALVALPAPGHAAPKAAYPPPNHPAPAAQAVSTQHARTPSDRDPAVATALGQERYYGSYGTSDPAAAPVGVPAAPDVEPAASDSGIATAAFALAVAAALALGFGLGRLLDPATGRLHERGRRHRAVR
jgi:hypothetical protein